MHIIAFMELMQVLGPVLFMMFLVFIFSGPSGMQHPASNPSLTRTALPTTSPLSSASAAAVSSAGGGGGGGGGDKQRGGQIHLIIGPMFARKTTEMKRRIERLFLSRLAVVCLINHSHDEKRSGTTGLVTHDGEHVGRDTTLMVSRLSDVVPPENTTHVFIDEGQFFPDLFDVSMQWARRGIQVTVAALNGDSLGKMWPQIVLLLPYAVEVLQLTAVCMECGDDAPCTRLLEGEPPLPTSGIRIGAQDHYRVRCLKCTN